jgi:MoaA/NifB/PqqE/SkfB family radical SAM enzyme
MSDLIDIKPKSRNKGFKKENFQDTSGFNEKNKLILSKIKFLNLNNIENLKNKNIIKIILNSYEKLKNNIKLEDEDFILTQHEIGEFNNLKDKDITKYILYRYKYNKYPIQKILEDYPPNINIEITSMCNLRCIMCYQSDKSFSNKSEGYMGHMNIDIFKKIIDELYQNVEAVTFASRGEPTLHPKIDEMLKYCEGKFLGLKLNTNATLLTEKKIHSLLSSDLQSLVLSIDEKDKNNYEKIRVNANFDKIMKNLESLKKIREKYYKDSKMRIRISGVKINKNQNIESMNNFYKEFADEIALVNYNPWQSAYDNDINEIKNTCSELYRKMFIWWDGKANPCDFDYKSILSKWNVKDNTIKSIWNSDYYNKLRELHKLEKRNVIEPCKRCISV